MKLEDYVVLNPRVTLTKNSLVPFVSMESVVPGNRWVRPTQSKPAQGTGSKFLPGDVLFARITPCLENGKIAQYAGDRPGLGSTEFFVLRARDDISDPSFVYYFALTRKLRSTAEKSMSGASGRQRAAISALSDFECNFPALLIQARNAGILSVYDEFAETNQRRMQVLEGIARALYREWFVKYRIPGHKKVRLVPSSIGPIPEGWELKSVSDSVDINPRVPVMREIEKPFVPMASLSNDSMLITDVQSRTGSSGSKFQNGDTLFARITPCLENGKTGFVQFLPNTEAVACGSTEFVVLRSRTLTPEFVYCLARSDDVRAVAIKSMSGASGRQRIQERCFESILIAHPPRDLLDAFSATVSPIFELIQNLHQQVLFLRATRDLLLPRLIAGHWDLQSSA